MNLETIKLKPLKANCSTRFPLIALYLSQDLAIFLSKTPALVEAFGISPFEAKRFL